MKALRVHAVLLGVAAACAFYLSGRDPVRDEDRNRVLAWERDTTDVVAVHFQSPEREVLIERRQADGGAYLWGTQIEPADAETGAETGGDPADGGGEGAGAARADTLEFPVGASGHTLVERWAALRVVRSLGVLTDAQEARFGLTDVGAERLAVEFRDGRREFALGDTTYGGSDRYAQEPATGVGYVLPSDLTRPLGIGEGSLRERWLHHYPADEVAQVLVTVGDTERAMSRSESGDWTPPDGDAPDAAFANFMQRVDQLAISGYENPPPAEALPVLLRMDYLDENGDSIGFLEVFRDAAAERDPYYLRTERTRILAGAVTALAERVAEALAEVF